MNERQQRREIDRDRKGERRLIPQAILACALVAVFVVIRQVYFV